MSEDSAHELAHVLAAATPCLGEYLLYLLLHPVSSPKQGERDPARLYKTDRIYLDLKIPKKLPEFFIRTQFENLLEFPVI